MPYKNTYINIYIYIYTYKTYHKTHTQIYVFMYKVGKHLPIKIKNKKINTLRAIALGMISQIFSQFFTKFIHKTLAPNFIRFSKGYEM